MAPQTPPAASTEKKESAEADKEAKKKSAQELMRDALFAQMTSSDLSNLTPEQRAKAEKGMEKQKSIQARMKDKFGKRPVAGGGGSDGKSFMRETKQVDIQERLSKAKETFSEKKKTRLVDNMAETPYALSMQRQKKENAGRMDAEGGVGSQEGNVDNDISGKNTPSSPPFILQLILCNKQQERVAWVAMG